MADVSSNNGIIHLGNYSANGACVIAIKATESDNYINPFHFNQCATAHALGLTVVHYHFARPGNVQAQIDHFRNTYLKGWRKGDYISLDLEDSNIPNPKQFAQEFITKFTQQTGHPIILYTYRSYAEELLSGIAFIGNRWWMADYTTIQPKLPKGHILWAWQYTNKAYFPGIGKADGSVVNANVATRLLVRKKTTRRR